MCFIEIFKVDVNNIVNFMKGEIGLEICDRYIIVSFIGWYVC